MNDIKTTTVRLTHLEMMNPHPVTVATPHGLRMAIMRADKMPVHFYRYLYETIGKPHHWMLRRMQSDQELHNLLQSDDVIIYLLYIDGCPAGFSEILCTKLPETAEILHFGLVPEYQGRGLAKFFLADIIAAAWSLGPKKLMIETNSLDSPRGLQLYQKMGFTPVSWADEKIIYWD